LALHYSTVHRADGVYKAARPKTAAATPPRAYFGAPVGIAPESEPDEEEEESLLLSAPAAPPEPPVEVDMVMDAVMDRVIESESVSVTYTLVELITLVLTATTALLVARDSGTKVVRVEVPTTLVMGTRFVAILLSTDDVLEMTFVSTLVSTGTVTISGLPAESVVLEVVDWGAADWVIMTMLEEVQVALLLSSF